MNKGKYGITDVLADNFRRFKHKAIYVQDIAELIKTQKEQHPELQFIEKTFKGEKWDTKNPVHFKEQLRHLLEKRVGTRFFSIVNWDHTIPVLVCNLTDADIVNHFQWNYSDNMWFNHVDNVPYTDSNFYDIILGSFDRKTGEEIEDLKRKCSGK